MKDTQKLTSASSSADVEDLSSIMLPPIPPPPLPPPLLAANQTMGISAPLSNRIPGVKSPAAASGGVETEQAARGAAAESKRRQETKELILRKLNCLKQKARQGAQESSQLHKSAQKPTLNVKSVGKLPAGNEGKPEEVAEPLTESERIVDELFARFKEETSNKTAKKAEEAASALQKIEDEIAELEKTQKEEDSNSIDELYGDIDAMYAKSERKKNKKEKKSKDKKEKKSKKKKKHDDPELDPEFFDVSERESSKKSRDLKRSRSRSRERSRDQRRRGLHSRSRRSDDRDRSLDRTRDRRLGKSRERSLDQGKRCERNCPPHRRRSSSGSPDRRHRQRSRSRSRSKSRRTRSRSKSQRWGADSERPFFIDKEKLRRIAMRRVMQMEAAGTSLITRGITESDLHSITSGGATVQELTSFCKSMVHNSDEESSDERNVNEPVTENEAPGSLASMFIANRNAPIIMNIKNAKQLPIMTAEDKAKLRTSFPVSSGTQHRKEEPNEWVPVQPEEASKPVFTEPEQQEEDDVSVLINNRLNAIKKIKHAKTSAEARAMIESLKAKKLTVNPAPKQLPGQFTGQTDARILTPQELQPQVNNPRMQAWLRKDQILNAPPIKGGVGQYLLQKMGWQEGQGLGKDNSGDPRPLVLDFNTTRQGLTAPEERSRKATTMVDRYNSMAQRKGQPYSKAAPSIMTHVSEGKHPVSALMEICAARKWPSPVFELLHESGPSHKKIFLMKVTVNNMDYQPSCASNNKKQAKTLCATVALQAMGMLPRTSPPAAGLPTIPLNPSQPSGTPPLQALPYEAPPTGHPANQYHSQPHTLAATHVLQSIPAQRQIPEIDLSSFR